MGYDSPRSLGDKETGGGLALPVWMDYMTRALRGVPEWRAQQPPDVTSLGGELYYDDMTPGHGFISTIGVSQAPPSEGVSGVTAPAPDVGEQEKQDIMNLFKGQ
jgi:penicillin-binding protein 1A